MPDTKSEFFEQVEFDFGTDPSSQKPKTVVSWNKTVLRASFDEIKTEIAKIKRGSSDYVPRPIDPGSFGFPAENAIQIFIDDPSDKAFKASFEGPGSIASQNWGAIFGTRVYTLLKLAREEKVNG